MACEAIGARGQHEEGGSTRDTETNDLTTGGSDEPDGAGHDLWKGGEHRPTHTRPGATPGPPSNYFFRPSIAPTYQISPVLKVDLTETVSDFDGCCLSQVSDGRRVTKTLF